MFILSQNKEIIVEMSGIYLESRHWTTEEGGMWSKQTVRHETFIIECSSKNDFGVDNTSRKRVVGEFKTIERARKEIESIAQAVLAKEELYMIKAE